MIFHLFGERVACERRGKGGTLSYGVPPLVGTSHRIVPTIHPLSERPPEEERGSLCG